MTHRSALVEDVGDDHLEEKAARYFDGKRALDVQDLVDYNLYSKSGFFRAAKEKRIETILLNGRRKVPATVMYRLLHPAA
jgi:hypothetical protein